VPSGGNPLISGLDDSPFGCVVDPSGKYLYVVNNGNGQDEGTVCEYSTANGSAASGGNPLIPAGSFKNSDAIGLDPTGTDLFVTNSGGPNTIGEFYASNGGAVNTSLIITGLDDPIGIVVVPEPASTGLLGVAAVGLLRRRVRRQQPYPPSST
jgi:DNA-binding beta-propeller fold protein YncE